MVKKRISKEKKTRKKRLDVRLLVVVVGLAMVVLVAMLFNVMQFSLVVGKGGRFNLVSVDNYENVLFVSYDAVEEKITVVLFPSELFIRSRSVGEYQIGKLYQLAQYEDDPATFVRRKIQGFMRVPVMGFIVSDGDLGESIQREIFFTLVKRVVGSSGSNITRLDALTLLLRGQSYAWDIQGIDSLSKEGVLVSRSQGGYGYNPARLMEYVDGKFFDWRVGQERYSVAVIDLSDKRGLATDLSDFITNMGSDVVMVREGEDISVVSRMLVSSDSVQDSYTSQAIINLLGIEKLEIGETEIYRSDIVLFIGSDMESIF